jgi:hypothetical protein
LLLDQSPINNSSEAQEKANGNPFRVGKSKSPPPHKKLSMVKSAESLKLELSMQQMRDLAGMAANQKQLEERNRKLTYKEQKEKEMLEEMRVKTKEIFQK